MSTRWTEHGVGRNWPQLGSMRQGEEHLLSTFSSNYFTTTASGLEDYKTRTYAGFEKPWSYISVTINRYRHKIWIDVVDQKRTLLNATMQSSSLSGSRILLRYLSWSKSVCRYCIYLSVVIGRQVWSPPPHAWQWLVLLRWARGLAN